jgi:hypothetical protein
LEALAGLFVQALRLCQQAGLVKLGQVVLDGTKMLANASPHRSVTHQTLKEREQYWKDVVEQLLVAAEKTISKKISSWAGGSAPIRCRGN